MESPVENLSAYETADDYQHIRLLMIDRQRIEARKSDVVIFSKNKGILPPIFNLQFSIILIAKF
jgi:hypothetical protein